jgi:hypothetical protein
VDVGGITGFEVTQIDQSSGRIASADGTQTAESFVPSTTYTMPSYSIAVSPSVIDYTNQNSVILNVTNYGSGNMAVVSLNGNALPAVPAAASIPLDVSSLPDGVITVTYYESANTQTLLSVSATATKDISDTTAPTVSLDPITSPSASSSQTLTGTVSDNLGTPSVQVRLSPGGITQEATVTGDTWTASVSGLSDATYTVTARATDGVGNTADTSPQTLVINTAAPSATLSTIAGSVYTGAQILTNDATPTLAGTATGGGSASVSQVDISLDNGTTWSPATGTPNWTYTPSANLADIIYSVQVRVINSVGTQSVTPFASAMRVDATAPTISSLAIDSPSAGTYTTGQVITAVATFSESVTGTATLPFSVNGVATSAQTCSGTGATWTCSYTLSPTDSGAITIAANALTGTLNDAAGNPAILTHAAVNPSITADTAAPTITGIAFSNTGCASNLCGPADVVNVDVTFSENVTPSSLAATIPVTIGGTTTYTAAYASQLSANTLRFTKTIAAIGSGETGALGTPLNPTITLTGGTLTDTSGNTATLTSTLAAGSSGYTVDTTAPTVAFTATAGSYASGQTLGLTATYSEPVSISAGGNPSVPLTLTTGTLTATDTGGAATSVTTRTFTTGTIGASGTHQDIDSTLNVGTVALGSATITDAAGNALTLTPTPATVTGVTINAPIVVTATNPSGGSITPTEVPVGATMYKVFQFTTVGTSTFTVISGGGNVEYLIVGGGGGGGKSNGSAGGGGGAGGYRSSVVGENSGGNTPAEPRVMLAPGSYSVVVGGGGAGSIFSNSPGSNGVQSSAFGIIAAGGGGGGGNNTGIAGGSSGGSSNTSASPNPTTPVAPPTATAQGYKGGVGAVNTSPLVPGGGGGAGGVGGNGSGAVSGNGGQGLASSITGASVTRGGGGGGAGRYSCGGGGVASGGGGAGGCSVAGGAGTANTGGGGGGGGNGANGGNGGSGIVIIRYPI